MCGVRVAAAVLAACAVAVPLAAAKADRDPLRFKPFASGVRGAWWIGAPRSEPGRLYVAQKRGIVRVLNGGRLRREPFTVPGLSSFGEDTAGEIYATSLDNGTVYKLSP